MSQDSTQQEPESKSEAEERLSSRDLLADCERRAIELYYAAPPEKLAGDCRRELVEEFGEAVVTQMLANGIGNNGSANGERIHHYQRGRRLISG